MAGPYLAELRIPADHAFIPAAKRVGQSLGNTLGFSLEEIDELSIAIAQACDQTVEACEDIWGGESGALIQLRYARSGHGIAVEVEALPPGAADLAEHHRLHHAAETRRALQRAQRQRALATQVSAADDGEMRRMAQEMLRVFVDDLSSKVDANRGEVRFRFVKYTLH